MNFPIQIVPAIKRMSLANVGCWQELNIDFIPTLNIITGSDICGKSTILRSILHFVKPYNSNQQFCPPSPRTSGLISIDFVNKSVDPDTPPIRELPDEPSSTETYGEFMLSTLGSYIKENNKSMALLIEDIATASLTNSQYSKCVELLNSATCQVICIIKYRCLLSDFPGARIYNCHIDKNNNAHIKQTQSGSAADKS